MVWYYSDTEYLVVRMGVEVFDASFGILKSGCPVYSNENSEEYSEEFPDESSGAGDYTSDDEDIVLADDSERRDIKEICDEACTSVPHPELFQDACLFECYPEGNIHVSQATPYVQIF